MSDKSAPKIINYPYLNLLGLLKKQAVIFLTVLLLIVFSFFNNNIISLNNLQNILVQSSYLSVFACAQMVVIITRGFDLSLGPTVSLVSVVLALAMVNVESAPYVQIIVGFCAAIGVALLVGMGNGFSVTVLRINPFVATLGMWYIVLTFSSTVSGGFPVSGLPAELNEWFAAIRIFGIPIQVLFAIGVVIFLALLLNHTIFGRSLYLIGSNPKAAYIAGIKVRSVLFFSYLLCSALVGLGSFLLTARIGSGEPGLGGSLTMTSIAAAVIGGVSLRGGKGTVYSPLVGAVFVTVLSNGMNLMRIDGSVQQIVLGLVIIVALLSDRTQIR